MALQNTVHEMPGCHKECSGVGKKCPGYKIRK